MRCRSVSSLRTWTMFCAGPERLWYGAPQGLPLVWRGAHGPWACGRVAQGELVALTRPVHWPLRGHTPMTLACIGPAGEQADEDAALLLVAATEGTCAAGTMHGGGGPP